MEDSPDKSHITKDDTRLKPIMDEDCRKELPPNNSYVVVGGMNVDMMDMDMD